MKVLGVSGEEQKALWLILGAVYHLGAAGATKGKEVNRHAITTTSRQGKCEIPVRLRWSWERSTVFSYFLSLCY